MVYLDQTRIGDCLNSVRLNQDVFGEFYFVSVELNKDDDDNDKITVWLNKEDLSLQQKRVSLEGSIPTKTNT